MEGKPHALGSDARCSMLDARQCIDRAQRNVGQHRRQEPQAADRATFASIEGKNRGPRSFPDLLVAAAAAPSAYRTG